MELLKTFFQLAGIIIGWMVVHRLSSQRDIDKARRELVGKAADSLVEDVNALYKSAKTYHMSDRDVDTEDAIKMSVQDITTRLNQLSDMVLSPDDLKLCSRSLIDLKKAITGTHFEDEHDGPLKLSNEQLKRVADEFLRSKRLLLNLKLRQFPATQPSRRR